MTDDVLCWMSKVSLMMTDVDYRQHSLSDQLQNVSHVQLAANISYVSPMHCSMLLTLPQLTATKTFYQSNYWCHLFLHCSIIKRQ